MTTVQFKAGGALFDDNAAVYIERQADHEALVHLHAMDYLLLIETRQQGKTSLINHLMRHPAFSNFAFAYVDVTTLDHKTEAGWYQTLCPRILHQLKFIARDNWPAIPEDSVGWRSFLSELAAIATKATQRIVIVLDEIGAISFSGATDFFSVLRDVYNSRQAEAEFKQLAFLLAGAFHPRDLIDDDKISPFNIAQRVRLHDFTPEEVRKLVTRGGWSEEQGGLLAQRIHNWTDGQPYLTQFLCANLGPNATPTEVDASVERLRREDENHFPPLLKRLNADKKLLEYVGRIQAGDHIKFYPRENRRQAQLELLGVLKADDDGYCAISNRIYELALKEVAASQVKTKSFKTIIQLKKEKTDSYAELKENLKNGNVIAFVGAGLSIGAGLPGWYDLISELAQRIDYKLPSAQRANSATLIDAAQAYINAEGLHSLVAFLKDKLDTTGRRQTAAHQALARLPISIVFTANYDNLLEQAYREANKRVHIVVKDSDIPFMRREPNFVNIVKFYGDLNQPDTIVLARQHYDEFFLQRPLMIKLLETELARSDVLYLGWSHTDPHFNLVFGELLTILGKLIRPSHAVLFNLPKTQRKELKRKHIRLVKLLKKGDRTEQIAAWLTNLAAS